MSRSVFNRTNSLQRWPVCLMLTALLPSMAAAQVRTTSEYLARMDSNGDGKVQLVEYQNWLIYAFDQMDANKDGRLSAAELPGGKGRELRRDEQMQIFAERFKRQDRNRNGSLDARELAAPPQ